MALGSSSGPGRDLAGRGEPVAPRKPVISLRDLGPSVALIVLIAFFAAMSGQFLTVANAQAILTSSSVPVVLVVGMTFILLQGSIDLSVEGVMAAASMTTSLLIANTITGYDLGWLAILAGILLGLGFGLANGLEYTLMRMPSLIVTLATWFIGNGVATLLFPGRQPEILDRRLSELTMDNGSGLSALVYIAGLVAVTGYLLQSFTQFGRLCFAIGADEKITRQAGLPVRFHKLAAYALMGALSGAAGVMISAQLGIGNPQAGQGYLFPTISAAVVGGTLLSGGRGGVLHSLVGVLILQVLQNGMVQLGVDPYLRHIVEGATIVAALVVGNWRLRSRLRVVK
jgi:ribose transport system permease protein